jgi:hypothetical protein
MCASYFDDYSTNDTPDTLVIRVIEPLNTILNKVNNIKIVVEHSHQVKYNPCTPKSILIMIIIKQLMDTYSYCRIASISFYAIIDAW